MTKKSDFCEEKSFFIRLRTFQHPFHKQMILKEIEGWKLYSPDWVCIWDPAKRAGYWMLIFKASRSKLQVLVQYNLPVWTYARVSYKWAWNSVCKYQFQEQFINYFLICQKWKLDRKHHLISVFQFTAILCWESLEQDNCFCCYKNYLGISPRHYISLEYAQFTRPIIGYTS